VTGLLAGQRALVTGGGHGIGRATALRFAAEGAHVAVLDVDEDAARDAAAAVDGVALVADVADPAATTAAVDEAAAALGGLTTVFANAGFGVSRPLESYDDDEFDRVVRVNLTGTFHTLRAALRHLRAAGTGAIVTMAGTTALRPARWRYRLAPPRTRLSRRWHRRCASTPRDLKSRSTHRATP